MKTRTIFCWTFSTLHCISADVLSPSRVLSSSRGLAFIRAAYFPDYKSLLILWGVGGGEGGQDRKRSNEHSSCSDLLAASLLFLLIVSQIFSRLLSLLIQHFAYWNFLTTECFEHIPTNQTCIVMHLLCIS